MTLGTQLRDSDDAILRAIADDRRRTVLAHLDDPVERSAGATVDVAVSDLRSHVESHASGPGPTVERSHEPAITLHHRDLPLLDDAGLLTYDRERGRIEYPKGERWNQLVDGAIGK